jgi:hypothetical protein
MSAEFGKGCGDVVVTVPMHLYDDWLDEGDLAGGPESWPCSFCLLQHVKNPNRPCEVCGGTGRLSEGQTDWHFYLGTRPPDNMPVGGRVYVVAYGKLRGYSPLTRIEDVGNGFAFVRRGGAEAVTIREPIKGFQGWRWRWWHRAEEIPYPDWQHDGITSQPRLRPGT